MVSEVLAWFAPRLDGVVVDATVGAGGHAEAVLDASSHVTLVGYDRDPVAVAAATDRLARFGRRARVRTANFANLGEEIAREGLAPPSAILMDLGLSDIQINDPGRGFSFLRIGPLDMRAGPDAPHTAGELLGHLSERELADLIFNLGEDRNARKIARRIVEARERGAIGSTTHLAELAAGPGWRGSGIERIHPATRTFQALRMAVNGEQEALASALPQALAALKPGGRLAVLTFNSLEDRPVKQYMTREAKGCLCPVDFPVCRCGHRPGLSILTKKAQVAGAAELARNPSARSAKLRVAERI
jgi:16S rRNA (cytosine1402-N4)-methyltransferase